MKKLNNKSASGYYGAGYYGAGYSSGYYSSGYSSGYSYGRSLQFPFKKKLLIKKSVSQNKIKSYEKK